VHDSSLKTDIPILAGMEAGHADPNRTLPLGAAAVLDAAAIAQLRKSHGD